MDAATRSHHDYDGSHRDYHGDAWQPAGGTVGRCPTVARDLPVTTASIARELRAAGFWTRISQHPNGAISFCAQLRRRGWLIWVERTEFGTCWFCVIAPDDVTDDAALGCDLHLTAVRALQYAEAVPR